jgi:aldehyde dehydrogenase
VWSRDGNTAYRFGRAIKGWTNCYHACPAHAAFGGYKQSGIGNNLLVSYSPRKPGFF